MSPVSEQETPTGATRGLILGIETSCDETAAALQAAFMLWLGIVATTYTLNQIYDNRPWRVWAINIGYHLVGMLVMALILTLWP